MTKRALFVVVALVAIQTIGFASPGSPEYEAILTGAGLNKAQVGMIVEDESGVIFSLNADRKYIPASLTKILTAGATLELLRPSFEFKTRILSNADAEGKTLKGALYLKGGGDPSFDARKLQLLTKQLALLRIRSIDGDLIIDDNRFDDLRVASWTGFKSFTRSSWNGFPLFVSLDPPKDYYPVLRMWKKSERGLRGVMASREGDFVIYKNMTQPDLWTGYNFKTLLQRSGIRVTGVVNRGNTPSDARVLAQVISPLPEVISQMMKLSNNYYAETLTRNLAAETGQLPATLGTGLNLIRSFMDQVGIPREDYHLVSAAGYSPENYISASALSKALKYLKNESAVYPAFLKSLPIAGVDGTLRYRFRKTRASGRIQAKTGHLEDVVGLAGYIHTMTGRTLTFAFIYNGPKSPSLVHKAFDKICVDLVQ